MPVALVSIVPRRDGSQGRCQFHGWASAAPEARAVVAAAGFVGEQLAGFPPHFSDNDRALVGSHDLRACAERAAQILTHRWQSLRRVAELLLAQQIVGGPAVRRVIQETQ
jgi:hypothetical protein